MGSGQKQKELRKISNTDAAVVKTTEQQAPGGPGQSGVVLCLTALDHCIEQIPFFADQETLRVIAQKANALLRAVQATLQSTTLPPQQQQPEQPPKKNSSRKQQLHDSDPQLQTQRTGLGACRQQQRCQGTYPLQVVEDKQPFVFLASRTAAAAAADDDDTDHHLGIASAAADVASRHGSKVCPNSIPVLHKRTSSLQPLPAKPLAQQQNKPPQKQQAQQVSAADAMLQGRTFPAKAGRGLPIGQEQATAAARAKQTPSGSTNSRTESGTSSSTSGSDNGNDSSSDGSSDRKSSGSSDSSSDGSSDNSGNDDSNSSSSSDASSDNSSSGSSDCSNSSSSRDSDVLNDAVSNRKSKSNKLLAAAAGGSSPSVTHKARQPAQQDQLHQCLVCKRMVETPDLFANKLTITCKVCVAGAVAGAVSRLSHCPKRGCSAADIKLGPGGFHQGNTGKQHYVSVTALKGFSIHYVKRRLTKKQAAAAKALQAAGKRGLLGSPAKKQARKKQKTE